MRFTSLQRPAATLIVIYPSSIMPSLISDNLIVGFGILENVMFQQTNLELKTATQNCSPIRSGGKDRRPIHRS
jgi:hypothetical protein